MRANLRLIPPLVAVACRLWALEWMPLSYDRGYPLGLGIVIRDALADGRLGDLPWMSLVASINLHNPAGASWFWAAVSAVDASPYVAAALVALLHAVVTTATAHRIAGRLFGEPAGLTAGLFAALSPWGAWVARGPWLQGTLEAFAALSAWLLFSGLIDRRPRRVLAGLIVVSAALHTYLAAFGLLAQAAVAGLFGWRRPPLRRALIIGGIVVAANLAWIGGAFVAARGDLRAAVDNPNAINEDLRPGELNLDPIRHALRLVSGRDYENTFGAVADAGWRDSFGDAQSTLLDFAVLLGLLLLLRRNQDSKNPGLWFLTPIALTFLAANFIVREWKVHVFYLTLASPMMYVLAAAPLSLLKRASLRYGLAAFTLIGHAAAVLANQASDIDVRRADPVRMRAAEGIAVGDAAKLGRTLAAQCASILSMDDAVWLTSWIGSSRLTHRDALRADAASGAALVEPSGATCLVETTPLAPLAQVFARPPSFGDAAPNAPPVITLEPAPADDVLYAVNLGWSLLQLDAPTQAQPGEDIVVRHVWRIDALPPEPHADWYFAPFINLIGPDGTRIAVVDGAKALLGHTWRPGAQIHSAVHLKLPPDVAPGNYTLELSLFDPNQKKNAVYFDRRDPATPVVVLQRKLEVRR